MTTPVRSPLPPVRKSLLVPWAVEPAFRRFTTEMASWWPLRSHSVGGQKAETVVFEGRVGGRIYEKIRGGEESTWGTVTAWEPPRRVAFTWHPGRPAGSAQQIEVRLSPEGTGTRLELVHEGWETYGTMAARVRRGYAFGWAYVLRHWADRRSSPLVWGTDALMWALSPLQRRIAKRVEAAERAAT